MICKEIQTKEETMNIILMDLLRVLSLSLSLSLSRLSSLIESDVKKKMKKETISLHINNVSLEIFQ